MGETSTSTKWIVIGVVAVAFLVLFRDEVAQLLSRAEEVSLGSGGITLQTPLGTTDVTVRRSQLVDDQSLYPPDRFLTYTSSQYGYAISYPRNSTWKDVADLGPQMAQQFATLPGYSIAIISPGHNTFDAMVAVRVYQAGSPNIQAAMKGFVRAAGKGMTYQAPSIDPATNSATLFGHDETSNTVSVSRVLLLNGLLYDIRAGFSPNISNQLKDEMNGIVNSFRLLN